MPGEMRAVDGETGSARMRRFATQLLLIFARAKTGNDLEVLFRVGQLAIRLASKLKGRIGDRGRQHLLVSRVRVPLNLAKLFQALRIVKVGDRSGKKLVRSSVCLVL